jgi:hypothetical protein
MVDAQDAEPYQAPPGFTLNEAVRANITVLVLTVGNYLLLLYWAEMVAVQD